MFSPSLRRDSTASTKRLQVLESTAAFRRG
jgi:hypothetical protein